MCRKINFVTALIITILIFLVGTAESKKKSGVHIEVVKAGQETSELENSGPDDEGFNRGMDEDADQNGSFEQEGDVAEQDREQTPREEETVDENFQEQKSEMEERAQEAQEIRDDPSEDLSPPDDKEPEPDDQEQGGDQEERTQDNEDRDSQ